MACGGVQTHVVAPDVALLELDEALAVGARLHHLAQRQVHPRVARLQVTVERLAVLELHQHRVPLRRGEQREGEHGLCGISGGVPVRGGGSFGPE